MKPGKRSPEEYRRAGIVDAALVDRSDDVMRQVGNITQNNIRGLADDTAKLAFQMMQRELRIKSTGALRDSIRVDHEGQSGLFGIVKGKAPNIMSVIRTTASNASGYGYGAAKEWGYHHRGFGRYSGHHIILRATWGMRKRYERGEYWKD